jgi:uncharacterized phage-associated protein
VTDTSEHRQDNAYDPRVVANAIIKRAADERLPITHIALQKLLYFAHGLFLLRHRRPLVSGYFEAWTFGPVHPAVYAAFKASGSDPIKSVARRKDLRTGELHQLPELNDSAARRVVNQTLTAYGDLTAGQLVRLSHARDGPWDIVSKVAQSQSTIGLRISNDLIAERFQFHKLSTCNLIDVGEPSEDTPLAHYGLG